VWVGLSEIRTPMQTSSHWVTWMDLVSFGMRLPRLPTDRYSEAKRQYTRKELY